MVGAIFVFTLTVLFLWMLKRFSDNRKLPPGPFRWPILGSLPQMLREHPEHPHLQLTGLARKYGGIMSIGYGVHYAVVLSNFEIMREILRRPEAMDRGRFEFMEQRNNFKNLGIVWGYGDTWREQKRYTVRLLRQFEFGRKMTMDEAIQTEVNDLLNEVDHEITPSDGIWNVDITRLSALSINILWASVGGYRFDPHCSKMKRHLQCTQQIFEAAGAKNYLAVFPFLKIFPEWSGYRNHYEIHRDMKEFMLELVEDAKQRRARRVEPESFIEAYLDDIEKNKGQPNVVLNEDQFVLTLMDLFIAGSDTIATAIQWIVLYLTMFPDVQKKVRKEMEQHVHSRFIPFPSTMMAAMPYTKAVLLEVMRHAPYIPVRTPRLAIQDFECAGYKIPKGALLFPNAWAILHDKSYWGDPENFRPERLLLPDGNFDNSKSERVDQFGIGARVCPGENMSMITLFMMTTGILNKYYLDIVEGREPSLEPGSPSLTIKPRPFIVKLIPVH